MTSFGSSEEFLSHVVSMFPPQGAAGEQLFRDFQEFGYVARQETTGITEPPKLFAANRYSVLLERSPNAMRQVSLVLLSNPVMPDAEFDSWLKIVRDWYGALQPKIKDATSRELRLLKGVESGAPATVLSAAMPATLLLTYRRTSDLVFVIDPPDARRRRIYATKGIG